MSSNAPASPGSPLLRKLPPRISSLLYLPKPKKLLFITYLILVICCNLMRYMYSWYWYYTSLAYNDVLVAKDGHNLGAAAMHHQQQYASSSSPSNTFADSPPPKELPAFMSNSLAYRRLSCFTLHYLIYGGENGSTSTKLPIRILQLLASPYIILELREFVLNLLVLLVLLKLPALKWPHFSPAVLSHWSRSLYLFHFIHYLCLLVKALFAILFFRVFRWSYTFFFWPRLMLSCCNGGFLAFVALFVAKLILHSTSMRLYDDQSIASLEYLGYGVLLFIMRLFYSHEDYWIGVGVGILMAWLCIVVLRIQMYGKKWHRTPSSAVGGVTSTTSSGNSSSALNRSHSESLLSRVMSSSSRLTGGLLDFSDPVEKSRISDTGAASSQQSSHSIQKRSSIGGTSMTGGGVSRQYEQEKEL